MDGGKVKIKMRGPGWDGTYHIDTAVPRHGNDRVQRTKVDT
jgi:hypothetical protein